MDLLSVDHFFIMNKSEILYKNLLLFGQERILEFLKNAPTYGTQFEFHKLNSQCNQKMYEELSPNEIYPARQSYFSEISDLEVECKKCWKYFMRPRNKSVKSLDVQFGKQLEEIFITYLKTLRINVIRADLKDRRYPDLLVLDSSKEIIAYIELKYHAAPFLLTYKMREGRECYEGSLTLDKKKIVKQLEIFESEIERPVFYVHWVDFPCIKGIFFQTSEQLQDMLANNKDEYTRKEREGDFEIKKDGTEKKVGYGQKVYPSIAEMGNFAELIKIIEQEK